MAMHGSHASVIDPTPACRSTSTDNRSACYRCHPGLGDPLPARRDGRAVAADGSLAIQCQSCHGSMSDVAAPARHGWLDEPACQSCHTGTAAHNNGEIRYTSAFDGVGPAARRGRRDVRDHSRHAGRRACRCIASPPATAASRARPATARRTPSSPARTATTTSRASQHQGHVGMLVECASCHGTVSRPPSTAARTACTRSGRTGSARHPDGGRGRRRALPSCHGADYRGTVLSRAQADRTLDAALRHASILARLPDRLLHLPHRPDERERPTRTAPPVVPMRPPRRRTTRRSPSRCRPATPTATRCSCASSRSRRTAPWASRHAATYIPEPGFAGVGRLHLRRLGRLDRLEPRQRDDHRRGVAHADPRADAGPARRSRAGRSGAGAEAGPAPA